MVLERVHDIRIDHLKRDQCNKLSTGAISAPGPIGMHSRTAGMQLPPGLKTRPPRASKWVHSSRQLLVLEYAVVEVMTHDYQAT
jgi:hypothetical protein